MFHYYAGISIARRRYLRPISYAKIVLTSNPDISLRTHLLHWCRVLHNNRSIQVKRPNRMSSEGKVCKDSTTIKLTSDEDNDVFSFFLSFWSRSYRVEGAYI